jgi:N6-adenosine-specific RNA methylase IME4
MPTSYHENRIGGIETPVDTALSIIERDELVRQEEIIERGLKTFVDVGLALMGIRDGKLYREQYGTFEVYCQERWGMDKRYANYQIAATKAMENLGTIVPILPTHEGQVRPLAQLSSERQIEAWIEACEIKEGLVPTAKEVEFVVKAMQYKDPPPIPPGKYRIIYADPPWKYSDQLIEGYGAAEHHYPAMTIDELCALPIKDLAGDNSVLFLWVTSPILEEAFQVINAWGFQYKSSFVWDKEKHNFGHYNSVRHEFLLVCTRGSCLPDNPILIDSVQTIEKSNIHSEKPQEFRWIIEDLYTWGDKIELFAREKNEGWEAWGNEVS